MSPNHMLHMICSSEKIKDNTMQLFTVNDTDIVVGRRNGKLFAFNNSCPHRGASLSKGGLKGDNIVCYMHGYEFNVFTGKLENMKSWKREDTWLEQNSEWRKAGDLVLYHVNEKNGTIFVDI
ncbi:MAG TPA: Rieske (2Fe-2S) protein [Candidatus Acidoferrum sp.]|nr:Rieske (2Fe-2S) protein [Candidatus Acidoferrum sp.]